MSDFNQDTTLTRGPLTIVVTHHEWDCGDGCCSSSGNTAEISDEKGYAFSYGDPERDGYMDAEEFADEAMKAYLIERDCRVQSAAYAAIREQGIANEEKANTYFHGMAIAHAFLQRLNETPNTFNKSKNGQLLKMQAILMENYLYTLGGDYKNLMQGHYSRALTEVLGEKE